LAKFGAQGCKGRLGNELGVLLVQATTLFILHLPEYKLLSNPRCFSLSSDLAVELAWIQSSMGQGSGNVAPSWAQGCVVVAWAGQSSAAIPVAPPQPGLAGGGL